MGIQAEDELVRGSDQTEGQTDRKSVSIESLVLKLTERLPPRFSRPRIRFW